MKSLWQWKKHDVANCPAIILMLKASDLEKEGYLTVNS